MDIVLIDKLLYLQLKFHNKEHLDQEKLKLDLDIPSYKGILDLVNETSNDSYLPASIRAGLRFKPEGIVSIPTKIEIFLFGDFKSLKDSLQKNTFENFQIENKAIIDVNLVQEGLIRNTILPFNTKRQHIDHGKIYNVPDYQSVSNLNNNSFEIIKSPFIKISSNLEYIRHNYLYKPVDISTLKEKNIIFEEFEVIYLHNWVG